MAWPTLTWISGSSARTAPLTDRPTCAVSRSSSTWPRPPLAPALRLDRNLRSGRFPPIVFPPPTEVQNGSVGSSAPPTACWATAGAGKGSSGRAGRPGWLLNQPTTQVLAAALEAEMSANWAELRQLACTFGDGRSMTRESTRRDRFRRAPQQSQQCQPPTPQARAVPARSRRLRIA